MSDKTIFVLGASGAGKTTALLHLQSQPDFVGKCYFFDDIGVPTAEEINVLDRAGISWQARATREWVHKLASNDDRLSILEGQTSPATIAAEATTAGLVHWTTILLDCDPETRRRRLSARGQPNLATERMNTWAAYLRGQADALLIPVVDTSDLSVAEVAAAIRSVTEAF